MSFAYYFRECSPTFLKNKLEDVEQHYFIAMCKPWLVTHELQDEKIVDGWLHKEDFDIQNLDKYTKVEYEDFDFYYDPSLQIELLHSDANYGHYNLEMQNGQNLQITPAKITPRNLTLSASKKKAKTTDDYLTIYGKYAYELHIKCTDKVNPHEATQEELMHLALLAITFNYKVTPELLEAICPLSDADLSLICNAAVGAAGDEKKTSE